MKLRACLLASLLIVTAGATAHEAEQPGKDTGFRESFLRTAFPLTREMMAEPAGDSSMKLDFSFPVSGPTDKEIRTIIDPTPPRYFDAPPHVGATTIYG